MPDIAVPDQVTPPEFVLAAGAVYDDPWVTALAVPVTEGPDGEPELPDDATAYVEALGLDAKSTISALDASAVAGDVRRMPVLASRTDAASLGEGTVSQLLFVGVGNGTLDEVRRAGAELAREARGMKAIATTIPVLAEPGALGAFVSGVTLGSFAFHMRTDGPPFEPVRRVTIAVAEPELWAEALDRATAIALASWRSRTWSTVPPNIKSPTWMVNEARQVAAESGLEIDVWDSKRLAKEGFGGILAVGKASASEPAMVRLDYVPAGHSAKELKALPHVALIGKCITFDSGGLSLKPPAGMVTMKRDMTGSAAVLATMGALHAVNCPVRVTGLLALAENSVSGNATRPGDVIEHYGGRTSEVQNTDAEGRLVMADALQYAVDNLKPSVIVDIATLTGARKVALGLETAAYLTNSEPLASRVAAAGAQSGEAVWRLPLASQYRSKLSSTVADATNSPSGPGTITAALFLEPFTGDLPWVHFDIVGDAEEDQAEWTKGPTGFGARILLNWLGNSNAVEGALGDH